METDPITPDALAATPNGEPFDPARGNCYQTAYVLLDLVGNVSASLVHGIVRRTVSPFDYMGHAWIEFETRGGLTFVLDPRFPTTPLSRGSYYDAGAVCYSVKYSLRRARKLHASRKDFGPWDQRVRDAAHAGDEPPAIAAAAREMAPDRSEATE